MMTGHPFARPAEPEPSFRQPPHNLDAEAALLGVLLLDNALFDHCEGLTELDFFDPVHGAIFAAISEAASRGRQANPITLAPAFKDFEPIRPDLTVAEYIRKLVVGVPSTRDLPGYVSAVRDLALLRRLHLFGEETAGAAQSSSDPQAVLEDVEKRLYALTPHAAHERRTVTADEAIEEAIRTAEQAYQRGGGLAGLSTGIAALDDQTGGLAASDLLILAGRPSMGKTALALTVADNVASTGAPVGVLSLEMASGQLGARLLSAHTRIPVLKMRTGRCTGDEIERWVRAGVERKGLPLVINEAGGLTLERKS
jgi:replicative DNA helicase